MRTLSILLAVAVLGVASGAVRAAPADTESEAKRYYQDGTKYYNLGDFTKAIENYKKAYELKPDVVFLYNIAQAYRLALDLPQALFFYKSYLRNSPQAPNRVEVENRIKEIEATLAKQKEISAQPPNDPLNPGTKPKSVEPPFEPPGDTDTDVDPEDGDTKVPSPVDAAEAGQDGETPTEPAVDSGGGKKPIYKKWWFWAGIGAVAVGTIAIVAISSGGASGAPDGHFGSSDIF